MITDPVADLLARIKNAQQRKTESIVLPSTKMVEAVVAILKKEGFILDYSVEEKQPQSELTVQLKYVNGVPAITELEKVSKPGIRKYSGYKDIKNIRKGLGIAIYSTPRGIMTGEQARKDKVGGEYICYIY